MSKDFVDKLFDGLKGAMESGKELAEELSQKGKLKYKIYSINKELRSNQTELGKKIYDKYLNKDFEVFNDEEILAYITEIKQLYALLDEAEEEYEEMQSREEDEEIHGNVDLREKYEEEIQNLKKEIEQLRAQQKEDQSDKAEDENKDVEDTIY